MLGKLTEISYLSEITQYFKKISSLTNIAVLISVKDTPGNLPEEVNAILSTWGVKRNPNGVMHSSFVAIVYNNSILSEKFSNKGLSHCSAYLKGHLIELLSKGYTSGDYSCINIDHENYSINKRGFNIVVFSPDQNLILDSVCFDTYLSNRPCLRNEEIKSEHCTDAQIILQMESKIDRIISDINFLTEKIHYQEIQWNNYFWSLARQSGESEIDLKKRIFLNMPKATGDLRTIQLATVALLNEFTQICTSNNLSFWASNGTLLGAIRHQGFIPWDDDIDLAMLSADYEKLSKVISAKGNLKLTRHYVNDYGKVFIASRITFRGREDPFLDIFTYDYCTGYQDSDWDIHLKYRAFVENEVCSKLRNGGKYFESNPETVKSEQSELIKNAFKKYIPPNVKNADSRSPGLVLALINGNTSTKWIYASSDIFPLKSIKFENTTIPVPTNSEKMLICYGDIYTMPKDMHTHAPINDLSYLKYCKKICELYKNI